MAIKGILEEELRNSLRMYMQYKRALRRIPKDKDVLLVKNIKDNKYFYKAHREGSQVVYKYAGKYDKSVYDKYKKNQKIRKEYIKQSRLAFEQIKALRRALSGHHSI